jgi:hypothetical protein
MTVETPTHPSGAPALIPLLLVLAVLKPSLGHADSFRCGQYLVNTGDSFVEVIDKCGEPLAKTGSVERIRSGNRDLYVGVEQWIYNTGKYRMRRILVFRNGFLDEVLVGSRQR